jgi:hypothetical protein
MVPAASEKLFVLLESFYFILTTVHLLSSPSLHFAFFQFLGSWASSVRICRLDSQATMGQGGQFLAGAGDCSLIHT